MTTPSKSRLMALVSLALAACAEQPMQAQQAPISYESGGQAVPAAARDRAIHMLNSSSCADGGVRTVAAQGATTIEALAQLQPDTSSTRDLISRLDPADEVFAVVVTGACTVENEAGDYTAHEGYVLFGSNGYPHYGRVWREGFEPHLVEPFGKTVEAALNT